MNSTASIRQAITHRSSYQLLHRGLSIWVDDRIPTFVAKPEIVKYHVSDGISKILKRQPGSVRLRHECNLLFQVTF